MADNRKPRSDLGASVPLAPPLYPSSVYTLPDLDALDRIMEGAEAGFIYARDGHPNSRDLAEQLRVFEDAAWAVVCGSGMAALTALMLAVLKQGDRIVASSQLYGRTLQLLGAEWPRLGVQPVFVDSNDLGQVRQALAVPARLLFVETLSNPLLRLADLEALAQLCREHDCLLAADNTFATPVLLRPLALGADLVVESVTKMLGGHSDVTLGLACGAGARTGAIPLRLSQVVSTWGLSANPFDCWLASRGLATLGLRMQAAAANAAALADWLAGQSGVARVIYPGRPDHPDHGLARRLLTSFGNIVCFDLPGGREAVNRFLRRAPGIPFSPSLGHTTTTCSHPASTSHRTVSPEERKRLGISDGLVRLSVGVEALEHIQQELARGL